MKRLLLTLIALASLTASAQSIFVKAGGGFASQYGAAGYAGVAKVALGYEYELSQTLAIAPSIGFAGRGWALADVATPDMLYDAKGNMLDADGNITTLPSQQAQRPVVDADGKPVPGHYMESMMHRSYSANYIQLDLPLNYYHRMGERRYVTLTAGPWMACGFAGKRTTEGDGRACGERKVRYTDKTFSLDGARRIDCGLKAGIGYQFPSSLTLNLEGEFGLLKTNRTTVFDAAGRPDVLADPFGGKASRNVSLMITVSYKLNKPRQRDDD